MKSVQLAHGSGGQAMQQLIASLFMQAFANPWLAEQEDQARLDLAQLTAQGDRLAFSTDSYVIDPLFFPGGDIGKLAVCGTANDVAVSGALPRYLSCGFILEEGLEMATLERVVNSMARTAQAAEIAIVTGDTKVVPRGAAEQGRDYHCQNIALHHYLLPSLIFLYEHLPLPPINSVNKNLQNY